MENKDTKLSVTFYVIFFALLFLVLAQVTEWWAWPQLARGNVGNPYVLGFVHLMVIGFVLQMMFGVLLKIVPIAFQGTLYSRILGFIQPWFLGVGDLVLVAGFLFSRTVWLVTGGSVIVAGLGIFLYNLFFTIRSLRNKTVVLRGVQLAIVYLTIALLLGLTTAIDLETGFIPDFVKLLQVHILVAVFAGFTQLISSISYKLIPMFLLSIKPKVHSGVVYTLHGGGLILALMETLFPFAALRWLALLLFGAGFIIHAWDVRTILATRHRKAIALPMWAVLFAYGVWVGISLSLALLWAQAYLTLVSAGIGLFSLAVLGFAPMILGYLLKIIPFLWFQHRYSHAPDRRSAPPLNLLIRERQGLIAITCYVLSQVGFMFARTAQRPFVSTTTALLLLLVSAVSTLYFLYILALVPIQHRRSASIANEGVN